MSEQVEEIHAGTIKANVGHLVLVGGASQKLVDPDASRDALIISADVADVWVSYGAADALVQHGHCVRLGGPPFIDDSWRGEVHVISAGAAIIGFTERLLSVGDEQGERPTGSDAFVPSGPGDSTDYSTHSPALPTPLPPGDPAQ